MMDPKVKQALDTTLRNWKAMSVARDIDESEAFRICIISLHYLVFFLYIYRCSTRVVPGIRPATGDIGGIHGARDG